MNWSLNLGSIAGIRLYVHWTMLILAGFVIVTNSQAGAGGALLALAFVGSIFACVALHELGHALMAKRFGIGTRDITLLPIGGIARLERMPERPLQEFLVAIAGPLVNVVIAAVLLVILWVAGSLPTLEEASRPVDDARGLAGAIQGMGFFYSLMIVNISLVVFNLIPAFPMDGGRMLRAALASRMDYAKATRIAAMVGQAFAIIFLVLGLFYNIILVLIALFVFLGAGAEARAAEVKFGLSGMPVREAMITRFRSLSEDDTLGRAVEVLLTGSQADFPVMRNCSAVGVLTRNDLVKGLSEQGRDTPVASVMRRDCGYVEQDEPLFKVYQRMQELKCPVVPVVDAGEVVGIVTLDNVGEFLMVQDAMRRKAGA